MKVICDRSALVEALNLVGGVVVSRTPKPVLTCVRLAADPETGLSLAATDLEVSLQLSTPRVEVQEAGEALIPADKLSQIVRESSDPTLTIEVEQETAVIRGQHSRFKVFGYPVGEFPGLPKFDGEADFELAAEDLTKLIHQTAFATARENSRYAINGVLMERDGNKITVVATDGRRLALAKGACKAAAGEPTSAIVPTKALVLMERLLDEQETVQVKLTQNQIIFATDGSVLASNLVEGNFPPYKDVIPRDNDKKATIAKAMLAAGVRQASLLTNEESKGVRMSFSSDGLTLSSRAPEMGEAEVHVELSKYDGEPVEIGFNPQFILDALKVIDSDQVQMEFKAGNKPGLMRTGADYVYVVMPVNLQA